MAAARPGESICTFSYSFPKASRDPLLIRAVYETLHRDRFDNAVPVRATDRLEEDLAMNGEDIDDAAMDLAALTGRCMGNAEATPLFGNVRTAGDLVVFLQQQPVMAGVLFR